MADTQTPPAYEPGALYDLVVRRPVSVGSFRYLPRHVVQAKGELINRIIEEHGSDAIRSADLRE
ncbi:MAG: hypothetical protein DI604_26390 [Delftia acidovorans]|nr:MAG: hypothetical protein DI604_26390 [Delftia acidovorans]